MQSFFIDPVADRSVANRSVADCSLADFSLINRPLIVLRLNNRFLVLWIVLMPIVLWLIVL